MDNSLNVPCCNIMGVNIAAINMQKLIEIVKNNLENLRGKYICVSNVHTTVYSYDNKEYMNIQNKSALSIPDGGPLSSIGRKRGFTNMSRTTGPDFLNEILKISIDNKFKHYFYGSTVETLNKLKSKINEKYGNINVVGLYSPPFRKLTKEEDENVINEINATKPDFVWVGLGAPKQEIWMYEHMNKIDGLMVGVGAAFDYMAENIKRAPKWMQQFNLEWLYRLLQDPFRLFKRYFYTNVKFIINAVILGK